MRWTVVEIADTVDGTVSRGDPAMIIDRVSQDSREIAGSSTLFVPLVADRDGHDFVAGSHAAATLSAQPSADLGRLPEEMAVIEVADTAAALAELASAGRQRLSSSVVFGITGSVGKTTTKDLLAAILAADRITHASERSFNNEIGVPLTILNAPDDTEALVIEMGARGPGHITRLCEIGQPSIGVVTTVGAAHTSEFGTVEAVAEAKGELVGALPGEADGGVAVLNAVNPLVAAMADRTEAQVITFGGGGDVRAEDVVLDDGLVPRFRLVSDWGEVEIVLGARGVHLVDNALAASAAAMAVGVPIELLADALVMPVLSPSRMSLLRTASGIRVLDDSYNANPMSIEAALRSLAALPATRRVAVLGVMAELGEVSGAEHARMGEVAAALGIEVIAVDAVDYLGRLDPELVSAALVADIGEAFDLLVAPSIGDPIGPDDAVLVKGSRVAGLERLVEMLLSPQALDL